MNRCLLAGPKARRCGESAVCIFVSHLTLISVTMGMCVSFYTVIITSLILSLSAYPYLIYLCSSLVSCPRLVTFHDSRARDLTWTSLSISNHVRAASLTDSLLISLTTRRRFHRLDAILHTKAEMLSRWRTAVDYTVNWIVELIRVCLSSLTLSFSSISISSSSRHATCSLRFVTLFYIFGSAWGIFDLCQTWEDCF